MTNNKIAIATPTKEEFRKVLEIFERKGWTWGNGNNPLKEVNYNWSICEEYAYIEYNDKFYIGELDTYLQENYKIISYLEFLEMELGLNPKPKICSACGQELKK